MNTTIDNPSIWTAMPRSGRMASRVAESVEAHMRERIERGLASGSVQPGDALPPERELAEALAISRGALRRALSELEDKGVVNRQQGRGTFVSPRHRAEQVGPMASSSEIRSAALLLPAAGSEFFAPFLRGFESQFRSAIDVPIHVRSTNSLQDGIEAAIFESLAEGDDAFVIAPTGHTDVSLAAYRTLRRFGMPFITVLRSLGGEITAPSIEMAGDHVADLLADRFVERGHLHAGVFAMHGNANVRRTIERLNDRLAEHGGRCPIDSCAFGTVRDDVPSRWMYPTQATSAHTVERHLDALRDDLERVISQDDPPSVIFAASNALAEEIYLLLLDMSIRVPTQISVIGYGATPRVLGMQRRLAAVVVDTEDMGRRAAQMLCELVSRTRPLDDATTIRLDCTLETGFTFRDLTASDSERHPTHGEDAQ
ncbi:MAG: GntR family transcriptional regulator [Planctomycetota bacterium]